jgi:hypothetical protein
VVEEKVEAWVGVEAMVVVYMQEEGPLQIPNSRKFLKRVGLVETHGQR